jgi:hypothetical protein
MSEQQVSEEQFDLIQKLPLGVAATIADRLGETLPGPRKRISQIVWALGRTQACHLLEQTLEIETRGGMKVASGKRRRSPGGVFFHLAYTTGQPKEGKTLARPVNRPRKVARSNGQSATPPAAPSSFVWEDRIAMIDSIGSLKGKVTTVKITLIGQIGKYVEKGPCVVGVMQHSGEKLPALPKGVPAPQAIKTNYVVYIASKQWKNVADTVNDPEDALIIEGFPQIDAKTGAISVFASNVTSKKLQKAKRA